MDEMLGKVREIAEAQLKRADSAHDFVHAERVANLARKIAEAEGADEFVVAVSCYMHDWGTYNGREYHTSEACMGEIECALRKIGFPEGKLRQVVEAVRHHETYGFGKEKKDISLEAKILQDADRLDSMGAIGIGRNFYTSGLLKTPFGTPDTMKRRKEDYHVGQIGDPMEHFHTKLLNLKDAMNTEYARRLALDRHNYMVGFIERLKKEWNGEL